jgi:hypothetical protein
MDPLREYLYIDRARLDSYFEQISTPVTYDKVPIWKTGIALTGPSAEGQQARFARPFTQHEKIQRVREYLHGNTWPFATLVGTASRVTVPANAGYSRLRGLALWVAREANNRDDPKTVCLLEDYKRDPDPDDPVYDGSIYSALVVLLTDMALQHQSSASEDDIDRQTCEPYPKEGGTVDQQFHRDPIAFLLTKGARVGAEHRIESLYRTRFTGEAKRSDGIGYEVTIGYPIWILEA